MHNSYDDDSDDSLPTHLFEWATTKRDVDGSTVASDVIKHDVALRRNALHESARGTNAKITRALNKLGEDITTLLEQSEFDCTFSVNPHSRSITLTYDDVDDVNNDKRNRHAVHIVTEVARSHGARVVLTESAERGHMGTMTVGFAGIGFGAQPRVDLNFDPYETGRRQGGHRIADLIERLGLFEVDVDGLESGKKMEGSDFDESETKQRLDDEDEMI